MFTMTDIISNCLELSGVKGYFDRELENDHIVLVLVFGGCFLSIRVLDDDSLSFNVSTAYKYDNLVERDLSNEIPWVQCIGKPVRWFWTMKNNQGYFDGVQFEFAMNVTDEASIIQLVGMASRIDSRLVTAC